MRYVLAALLAFGSAGVARAQEQSVTEGPTHRVQADEIDRYFAEKKVLFLDVRTPKELEELGTIEGYTHIPVDDLEKRYHELPKDRLILTA